MTGLFDPVFVASWFHAATRQGHSRMAEIPLKLEDALVEHGVTLHIGEPVSTLYTS
jgi:hypothetical protein